MNVVIDDKKVRLNPSQSIGKGGEADVFLRGSQAIKIYKPPKHPDFKGDPASQRGAELRIAEHQRKLPDFPTGLPQRVISPDDLVYDTSKARIIGYAMKFIADTQKILLFSDKGQRGTTVTNEIVQKVFIDLHGLVKGLHQRGVVVGDFNDLNVLIKIADQPAYLIDADSYQWGSYLCRMFTDTFVDPLLCDPNEIKPSLAKPYAPESDWYAFFIMLIQSLLLVGPYDGIYRPQNKKNRIPHGSRPLHRVSILNGEVKTPKWAYPCAALPDELLQYMQSVLVNDRRDEFPLPLIENMNWTVCNCGIEHAKGLCPACSHISPTAVKQTVIVRGNATSTTHFETTGSIVFATYQEKRLSWLVYEEHQVVRHDLENGIDSEHNVFGSIKIVPGMRFRICGDASLTGVGNKVVITSPGKQPTIKFVDTFEQTASFDANAEHTFWVKDGNLYCSAPIADQYIGDVLANQTMFWVGPDFGLGFYRAGKINQVFTFDRTHAINDNIARNPISGHLLDSTCFFGDGVVWFLVSIQEGSTKLNRCMVIDNTGNIIGEAEAVRADGSWLGTIRGKCAYGSAKRGALLAATDSGIARIEASSGTLLVTKEFPDTERFVSDTDHLFPATGGLYVVNAKNVQFLEIS